MTQAVKSDLVRYRNVTKMDQTFYLKDGSSVEVLPGGTVLFPESFGGKFRKVLEPVVQEQK
jgi:hypothetical protein